MLAAQFDLADPEFPVSLVEVEENVRMVEFPIPSSLWAELKDTSLIAAAAPTPQ